MHLTLPMRENVIKSMYVVLLEMCIISPLAHIIKTHDSESRGQEEAQQRDH